MCSLTLAAVPLVRADHEHAGGADKHFQMLDANGDGRVSREEHAAGAKKMFDQMDANHDGIVTAAEMDSARTRQGMKAQRGEMSPAEKIAAIDADGDGKLTAAEHATGSEKMFARQDKDGDGFLSREEVAAGMKLMKKGT